MKKVFGLTAILMSSGLLAQDTTALQNLTVTASKFSTKTTQTGKVVITITRDQLEKAGSRDLSQVITEMGGLFINGYSSNYGKEKNIYLRGAKVDYTLITIDGVPVYDASGIASNFDIRNVPVDNVERIEILKGSQSTLYGSDAIAGVINIITRKGATKPFAVSGVANYGSYNTFRGNVTLSGQQKAVDYNIGISHFNTTGFSEAKPPVGSTGAFDRDGYQQTGVQANVGIQVSPRVRLQPFVRYSQFRGDLDLDAFQDEKDFTNKNKNLQLGLRNHIGVGKGQLTTQYQLTHTKRDYLDDSSFIGSTAYYIFSQQQYKAAEHFAEAFMVYPFGDLKVTAGADARFSGTDYKALQKNVYAPTILSSSAYGSDSVNQNQVGVYAALNFSQGAFSIESGNRLNFHSEYGSNAAFNLNPSYFIGRRVKVFANASSGYKTPSLYQLFSVYGNAALQPETSLNLEGGAQVFSANETSYLRVTYFNRRIKDVIAFFYNPATFRSSYINQDKQNDHGLELDGNLQLSEKLTVRAFYSYVDGNVTTRQRGKDTAYFNLLRRPKNTFNLSVGSQLTKAFYLSAQLNAIGERNDIYFDPVTFRSSPVSLNSYVLLNVYAEYAVPGTGLKFFADLRNLLDKDYMDIYGYNTARFNGYGGVRFRF